MAKISNHHWRHVPTFEMESEGAVSVMEIRPMPAEVRGKRVKLCDFKLKKGYCSKKDSCTFAHSEEEKKAWEACKYLYE